MDVLSCPLPSPQRFAWGCRSDALRLKIFDYEYDYEYEYEKKRSVDKQDMYPAFELYKNY
jgi:hypothetical protein